jgi:putative transposase
LQDRVYERIERSYGYANESKLKKVKIQVGEINLDVPQVREGVFYPRALEKGQRSE